MLRVPRAELAVSCKDVGLGYQVHIFILFITGSFSTLSHWTSWRKIIIIFSFAVLGAA